MYNDGYTCFRMQSDGKGCWIIEVLLYSLCSGIKKYEYRCHICTWSGSVRPVPHPNLNLGNCTPRIHLCVDTCHTCVCIHIECV